MMTPASPILSATSNLEAFMRDSRPDTQERNLRVVNYLTDLVPTAEKTDAVNFFPRTIRGTKNVLYQLMPVPFGRLSADIEMSGHKPLTREASMGYISDINVNFYGLEGENLEKHRQHASAASALLSILQDDEGLELVVTVEEPHPRETLWGVLKKDIKAFFAGREEVPRRSSDEYRLAASLRMYARVLNDKKAARKMNLFLDEDDDALDKEYDKKYVDSSR